jgi:hypothetical protein
MISSFVIVAVPVFDTSPLEESALADADEDELDDPELLPAEPHPESEAASIAVIPTILINRFTFLLFMIITSFTLGCVTLLSFFLCQSR